MRCASWKGCPETGRRAVVLYPGRLWVLVAACSPVIASERAAVAEVDVPRRGTSTWSCGYGLGDVAGPSCEAPRGMGAKQRPPRTGSLAPQASTPRVLLF
jgi:hypothetical protein